jgi:hypothetical protein
MTSGERLCPAATESVRRHGISAAVQGNDRRAAAGRNCLGGHRRGVHRSGCGGAFRQPTDRRALGEEALRTRVAPKAVCTMAASARHALGNETFESSAERDPDTRRFRTRRSDVPTVRAESTSPSAGRITKPAAIRLRSVCASTP